jgi:serine/threonine-protein kinase RsbW
MTEPAWTWSLHREIPSSLDAGHKQIELLLAALSEHGWEGRDLFHVQMAAEEAMVNAVTHGNQLAEDKVVEIEFRVAKDSTYLRFKDQGQGFCPDALPDPRDDDHLECTNGRGVMLIREMMSDVKYNERGNEVIMTKSRQAASNDTA